MCCGSHLNNLSNLSNPSRRLSALSRAPGIWSRRSMCAFMRSLVHVSTGPTDRSARLRLAARALSRASRPARSGRARIGPYGVHDEPLQALRGDGLHTGAQPRPQTFAAACEHGRVHAWVCTSGHCTAAARMRGLAARLGGRVTELTLRRSRAGARTGRSPVLMHE